MIAEEELECGTRFVSTKTQTPSEGKPQGVFCWGWGDCNKYKESKAIIHTILKTSYNPMGENSRELTKKEI